MFSHADRFPTGPALSTANQAPVPWALRHLRPYQDGAAPAYASVELDGPTQTARYLDSAGRVVDMGKHSTSTGTNPPTGTNLDSQPDSDTGNDTDQ
jgi:putative ATP-grasp target RiPP